VPCTPSYRVGEMSLCEQPPAEAYSRCFPAALEAGAIQGRANQALATALLVTLIVVGLMLAVYGTLRQRHHRTRLQWWWNVVVSKGGRARLSEVGGEAEHAPSPSPSPSPSRARVRAKRQGGRTRLPEEDAAKAGSPQEEPCSTQGLDAASPGAIGIRQIACEVEMAELPAAATPARSPVPTPLAPSRSMCAQDIRWLD
jgi:hypothetical protein